MWRGAGAPRCFFGAGIGNPRSEVGRTESDGIGQVGRNRTGRTRSDSSEKVRRLSEIVGKKIFLWIFLAGRWFCGIFGCVIDNSLCMGFLKRGGGYRSLIAFKLTEIIEDLTEVFVKRYVRRGSRTRDQMEQAARSGKQNIAEGSETSMTSRKSEIHLTNVARASLAELLLDYEDYARHNAVPIWGMDHRRMKRLQSYVRSEEFMSDPTRDVDKMDAEMFCNLCITLIHQADTLLKRLLEAQQKQFLDEGGVSERMYRARMQRRQRGKSDQSDGSDGSDESDESDGSDRSDKSDESDQSDQSD